MFVFSFYFHQFYVFKQIVLDSHAFYFARITQISYQSIIFTKIINWSATEKINPKLYDLFETVKIDSSKSDQLLLSDQKFKLSELYKQIIQNYKSHSYLRIKAAEIKDYLMLNKLSNNDNSEGLEHTMSVYQSLPKLTTALSDQFMINMTFYVISAFAAILTLIFVIHKIKYFNKNRNKA